MFALIVVRRNKEPDVVNLPLLERGILYSAQNLSSYSTLAGRVATKVHTIAELSILANT